MTTNVRSHISYMGNDNMNLQYIPVVWSMQILWVSLYIFQTDPNCPVTLMSGCHS